MLLHWDTLGYEIRIELIWDHDRRWGCFELGSYYGVLLIDPGPSGVIPTKLPFRWREFDIRDPELNNCHWHGEDQYVGESGRNHGYFNSMFNTSMPGDCCEFKAKRAFGPALVPRSLLSFIQDWNNFASNLVKVHEKPRAPVLSHADSEGCKKEHPSPEKSNQSTEDNALTGIFDVSSNEIEDQWPDKASHVYTLPG